MAATFGGVARVNYIRNYPVMVNTPEQTDFAAEVARSISGSCNDAPLVMGGEDFAFMLQARPGCFMYVGNGETAGLHHPEYDFNDETIAHGITYWVKLAETVLAAKD